MECEIQVFGATGTEVSMDVGLEAVHVYFPSLIPRVLFQVRAVSLSLVTNLKLSL